VCFYLCILFDVVVLKYKRETTDAKFSDKIGRLSVHSTKKKFFRISQKMVGVQVIAVLFVV